MNTDILEGLKIGQVKESFGRGFKITAILREGELLKGEWGGNARNPRVFTVGVDKAGRVVREVFTGHEINFFR